MRTLQVVGRDDDKLVVMTDTGERFHLPIDQTLTDAVRRPVGATAAGPKRVAPKDIQAHIRRGLTAQQVADLTGETVDYVAMFEGPVIAEREFIAQQAQAIQFAHGSDRDGHTSFGESVRARLNDIGAGTATWSAWKEESGWFVEAAFADSNEVEHKAVWSFDPRKQILVPQNDDATALSQSEPIQGPLIPRLRPVVATDENPAGERFDSEMFDEMPLSDTGPLTEPVPYGRTGPDPAAPTTGDTSNETADLLEALRRRRGEREPAPSSEAEDVKSRHPSTGSIRLVQDDSDEDAGAEVHQFPGTGEIPPQEEESADEKPAPRKGRPEMPSWDDIVFGAKPDDDSDPA